MKRHVKNFLASRGVSGFEPLLCEWCWRAPLVDIHHVARRGMGGSKKLDGAENLIGLCRPCHAEADANRIPEDALRERVGLILNERSGK